MKLELSDYLANYSEQDWKSLADVLEIEKEVPTKDDVLSEIKWLYHSRARAHVNVGANKALNSFLRFADKETRPEKELDDVYEMPSYDQLLNQLAKKLSVFEEDVEPEIIELNISHAVVVAALKKMSPKDRRRYFSQPNMGMVADETTQIDGGLKGPATAASLLLAANSSGFALYTASTTALGFATQAVGITLPFAAYIGLTQSIAFATGPVGWLAAGGWFFRKATDPEWGALTRVVLFIIARKSGLVPAEN